MNVTTVLPRAKAVTNAHLARLPEPIFKEATHMKISFNVAEKRWRLLSSDDHRPLGHGCRLCVVRQAQGIVQCISNSPFISWLSVFGLRGEAYVLGVAQFAIAALLVAGVFSPILSAVGSLMGVVTFAITWSFFFTTPGVVKWSFSTDPIAWNLAGEFLFKDIVLLCVCVVLFLASLPQSVVRSRTTWNFHDATSAFVGRHN
jgi:uncharacterized membrane protein YkgB